MEYEVDRHTFVDAIGDLLRLTMESVARVLDDAHVTPDELNHVLLVGGSTRNPAVWELVANSLGTEPHMSINPEEVVALGAGVQAGIIAGQPIDAILVDVTPHSLGIEVVERRLGLIVPDCYSVLIRRNTTLHLNQDTVEIKVYQGENINASENRLLGEFRITGLEPEHPGEVAKVTVRFDFDVNGVLKVTARDRHTGQEKDITIEATRARLSEADIMDARERIVTAKAAAPPPAHPQEALVLVERAKQLVDSDELEPEDRTELVVLLDDLERARQDRDAELVDQITDDLLGLLFDLES